jgi:hypothetical protein
MSIDDVAYSRREFHRRRAEIEMEKALHAAKPTVAMIHLELPKIHRERRDQLAQGELAAARLAAPSITRTDKES